MKRSRLYTCMASVMSYDSLSFLKYRFVWVLIIWCTFDCMVSFSILSEYRYCSCFRWYCIVFVFNKDYETKSDGAFFLIVITLATTTFLWATMASDSTSSHTRLPRISYALYSVFAKMNASKSIKIIELPIYRPPMCTDSFNKLNRRLSK
jgi:hypothetical protein